MNFLKSVQIDHLCIHVPLQYSLNDPVTLTLLSQDAHSQSSVDREEPVSMSLFTHRQDVQTRVANGWRL